jgi:hypothetical protein
MSYSPGIMIFIVIPHSYGTSLERDTEQKLNEQFSLVDPKFDSLIIYIGGNHFLPRKFGIPCASKIPEGAGSGGPESSACPQNSQQDGPGSDVCLHLSSQRKCLQSYSEVNILCCDREETAPIFPACGLRS